MNDEDLVTVAAFADVAEAELAKERLELEGVLAFVVGAQTSGVMPFLIRATPSAALVIAIAIVWSVPERFEPRAQRSTF
jgi:hypothetical protein